MGTVDGFGRFFGVGCLVLGREQPARGLTNLRPPGRFANRPYDDVEFRRIAVRAGRDSTWR